MIRPLQDNVLLEKVPNEKKVGSIVLTSEKKAGNIATVVAVGPGKKEDGKVVPIAVKEGEKVVYREYSGTEFEEGDKKYILVREEDILAVIA